MIVNCLSTKFSLHFWCFYSLHGGKMRKLRSEYWDYFTKKDEDGKIKGDGIKFEELVKCLLTAFWIYFKDKHLWAECKNYKDSIAMNILAPTLVMAHVYEVNEILFFSRSSINSSAKNKILAFGEKSNKRILSRF